MDSSPALENFLRPRGYEVYEAESCRATLSVLQTFIPDAVFYLGLLGSPTGGN
jgi:hypothetical protein